MDWRTLVAGGIAVGLALLFWYARGIFLMPVPLDAAVQGTVVLRICGSAKNLEQTINGVHWLRQNGTLPMRIVVVDAGMDPETRRIAAVLAQNGKIYLE